MNIGIYKIICKETGKVYVGQSRQLDQRFRNHMSDLKRGKHGNLYMKRAYEKYGKDAFEFVIIEHCEVEKLEERERFWINFYDSCNEEKGFNLLKDPKFEKAISLKWEDPEFKKIMSEKHKKRWEENEEFREKNLKAIRDNHQEQIKRFGCLAFNTEKGKEKSKKSCSTDEYKKKRSEIRLKELQTEEGKARNEELLKKARSSPLRKENLQKHNQWQAENEEHKKKLREMQSSYWKDPEHTKRRIEAIKEGLRKRKLKLGIENG